MLTVLQWPPDVLFNVGLVPSDVAKKKPKQIEKYVGIF